MLLRASVSDLRVEVAGASFRVPRAEVALSPRSFSEGAIFLRSLELDSPRLELEAVPEPSPPVPVGGEPATLPPVRVDRLAA